MLWEEHFEKLFLKTVEVFKTATNDMRDLFEDSHHHIKCSKDRGEALKQY